MTKGALSHDEAIRVRRTGSSRLRERAYIFVALLLAFVLAFAVCVMIPEQRLSRDVTRHRGVPTAYEVVAGIFIQDDPDFESDGYDSLNDSFGLIDKSPERWTNLAK